MKVLYKKGWLIRISSWENDGDNGRTEEVLVETEARAKQLVEFAQLFDGEIGNLYDPEDDERQKVTDVFLEFNAKYPDYIDVGFDEDPDAICDWFIDEAYDLGLSGGDYYTRYCDKIEVLYFPEDVLCEDVTERFK